MRAARVIAGGIIECTEVPDPEPRGDQVLVRTRRASLCGSDLHFLYAPLEPVRTALRPGAPGHEAVGEVVASRSPQFRPGDAVLTVPDIEDAACFADLQVVDPAFILPLPATARAANLVLAQPLGTVLYGLRSFISGAVPDTALVLGQGSIGLLFTWLLKQRGVARVITADLEPHRRRLSAHYGADLVSGPRSRDVIAAVLDSTAGAGAPLVIEAAGRDETRRVAIECAAPDGTVGIFGLPEASRMQDFPMAALFRRRLTVRATYGAQLEPDLRSFREALALIDSGALDVAPLITHEFPIDRIADAFGAARGRADGVVKTCISFD